MQAFRLTAWGRGPELCDVPEPAPADGEAVVEVAAAGMCHSDLHLARTGPDGGGRAYAPPFTLGHEIAGRVVAVGAGVPARLLDAAVVVYGPLGCGVCPACRRGTANHCVGPGRPRAAGLGLGRDGGMAAYVVVPARQLVEAVDLDPVQAAVLGDAGMTARHVVAGIEEALSPEARVLVIGAGGLGHVAVQVLHAVSECRVVVVDRKPEALAGWPSGPREVVVADDLLDERLDALGAGRHYDAVLDFVGTSETIARGALRLRPGGTLAVVGSAGGSLEVRKRGALPPGARLTLPYWGTAADLTAVIALARDGRVAVRVETVPLTGAPRLLARLAAGEIAGRGVLLPSV